jgi:hypothetical protein
MRTGRALRVHHLVKPFFARVIFNHIYRRASFFEPRGQFQTVQISGCNPFLAWI